MIRVKFSGPDLAKKIRDIHKELMNPEGKVALAMKSFGDIIAENIKQRLLTTDGSRSTWREDPDWAKKQYLAAGAGRTRRIADLIDCRIYPTPKGFFVGIGNIGELATVGLSQATTNDEYQLWSILEYGTGIFSTHPKKGGAVIERRGRQKFPNRAEWGGEGNSIVRNITLNPGMMGRHYFVTAAGMMHDADYAVISNVRNLIKTQLGFVYAMK